MFADDPFADFDNEQPLSNTSSSAATPMGASGSTGSSGYRGGNGGNFAKELFSVQVKGKLRTFFFDLKESSQGKFFKVSEKSRGGQKTTIMCDAEDIDQFISALQSIKAHL